MNIVLRAGRTEEQVYADAALVGGYKNTIETPFTSEILTEEEKSGHIYPENYIAEKVSNFTQEDGSVLYKISYTILEPNLESATEFGKKLIQRIFGKMDAEQEGEAAGIRATQAYENM